MHQIRVGVIGNGWVGKAMQELFPEAIVYVRDLKKLDGNRESYKYTDVKSDLNRCDIVFVCVPTPNRNYSIEGKARTEAEGELDISAVEECVSWIESDLIVIRSTVNPGDCDYLYARYGKNIIFQPEYLGESPAHPLLNVKETDFMIIGGLPPHRQKLINLYHTVYNANIRIRQTDLITAEMIKLTENRAIAYKVAQCQEIYDVCEMAKDKGIFLDYVEIIQGVYGDDPRFNLWWTFVYPEKRGFNSKCIPKDVYAWCAFAESLGYKPEVTRALLEKNKEYINGTS